jgi:dTDP-4-dehydrorhamnose 3,5-epimerase
MNAIELDIAGVWLITPKRYEDQRGFFAETYSSKRFAELGIDRAFVQDNLSCSSAPGTVRGLHFQRPPKAQSKLVRVVRGSILDVCVDLRRSSPSFGRHLTVELSAEQGNQIFVPAGFAHGFWTMEPDTEVAYKVDDHYAPEHEDGLVWNDRTLAIDWPVTAAAVVISPRDAELPEFDPSAPAVFP